METILFSLLFVEIKLKHKHRKGKKGKREREREREREIEKKIDTLRYLYTESENAEFAYSLLLYFCSFLLSSHPQHSSPFFLQLYSSLFYSALYSQLLSTLIASLTMLLEFSFLSLTHSLSLIQSLSLSLACFSLILSYPVSFCF